MKMNNLRAMPVEINWRPEMPIFASQDFLKSLCEEYGWVGGLDDSDRLRCILPYTVIRKPGFRFVRFRVETIPLDCDLTLDEERLFLDNTLTYFRSAQADMIIPAANTALFRTYPEGAIAADYGTFIKDLRQPEAALFNEIHADYRKRIRHAMRNGVEIKSGSHYLDLAYDMVTDTLKRSGGKVAKKYEEFKRTLLSLGQNLRIFVAEHQGTVQACLVTAFSKYSAYTLYGGTISEPAKGAMHLLHWEAIRQLRELGAERFNFTGVRIKPAAGSKQAGIKNFKMRFGGALVQGHMWKYSFHPIKSLLYSVGVRLMIGGDVVDQERGKG